MHIRIPIVKTLRSHSNDKLHWKKKGEGGVKTSVISHTWVYQVIHPLRCNAYRVGLLRVHK